MTNDGANNYCTGNSSTSSKNNNITSSNNSNDTQANSSFFSIITNPSIPASMITNPVIGGSVPIRLQYITSPPVLPTTRQLSRPQIPPSSSSVARNVHPGSSASSIVEANRLNTIPLPNYSGNNVSFAGPNSLTINRIRTPHPHDVLCGRGGCINSHPGNKTFRDWVRERKELYNLAPSKAQKARISQEIVSKVRALRPPGKFLMREDRTTSAGAPAPMLSHTGAAGGGLIGWWIEIDDIKAMAKTSQALREGAPIIRAQHKDDDGKHAAPSSMSTSSKNDLVEDTKHFASEALFSPTNISQAGSPISAEAMRGLSKEQATNQTTEAVKAMSAQQQPKRKRSSSKDATISAVSVPVAVLQNPLVITPSTNDQLLATAVTVTHEDSAKANPKGVQENSRGPKVSHCSSASADRQHTKLFQTSTKSPGDNMSPPPFVFNRDYSVNVSNQAAQQLAPLFGLKKRNEASNIVLAADGKRKSLEESMTPFAPPGFEMGGFNTAVAQNSTSLTVCLPYASSFTSPNPSIIPRNSVKSSKRQLQRHEKSAKGEVGEYIRAHSLALSEISGYEGFSGEEEFTDPFEDEERNLQVAALARAAQKATIDDNAGAEVKKKEVKSVSKSNDDTAIEADEEAPSDEKGLDILSHASSGAQRRLDYLLSSMSSSSITSFSLNSAGEGQENTDCCMGIVGTQRNRDERKIGLGVDTLIAI